MIEIADDPRYRAVVGIENTTASQWLSSPSDVAVPSKGPIPIDFCLDSTFPYTTNMTYTHLMWRLVEPTRQQDDFGPTEWKMVPWEMSGFADIGSSCELLDGSNGTVLQAHIPAPDSSVGKIHYKAMLGTTNGAFPFSYPTVAEGANYYELSIPYRASFGSSVLALLMFSLIATMVWGGLGYTLKEMFNDERDVLGLPPEMRNLEED